MDFFESDSKINNNYNHLVGGNSKITIDPIITNIPSYTPILPPLRNDTMIHDQLINHLLGLHGVGRVFIFV